MPNIGFQEVHISWNHNLPVSSQELCLAYNNILKNLVTYVILDLSKDKILFCEKSLLRNFAKFTGNTCARVSILRDSGTGVLL